MKRRSQLISFFLTLVMLLGVFFVLPKEVRADLSDDYYIDDETEVKINDGLARTYYAPKDTGYYIFYCDAWGTDVSKNATTPMVKDTDTKKLLEFYAFPDPSRPPYLYYKLEAGKIYEITFSFSSEYTYAKITTMREFLFIKESEKLNVDYGSDTTLVAEAYSPCGEITYTWDKGDDVVSGPVLELKNISKKTEHTCYASVETPKGTVTFSCSFYVYVNDSDFRFEGDEQSKTIAVPYGSDYILKIVRGIPMPEKCEVVWDANGEKIKDNTSTTCTIKNITEETYVRAYIGYKIDSHISTHVFVTTTLYPENDLAISIKGAKTASEGAFNDTSYEFVQGDGPNDPKDKEVSYIVVDPSKSITIEAELKGRDLSGSSITWSRDKTVLSETSKVTIDPDFYTASHNNTKLTVKGKDKYGVEVSRDLYLVPKEYESIINDPFKTIEVKKGEDVTLSVDPAVTLPEWDFKWVKTDKTGYIVAIMYPVRTVSSITAENITEEAYYRYWAYIGNFSPVYQRFRVVPITPTPTPTTAPISAPTATPKATATPKVTATPAVTTKPTGGAELTTVSSGDPKTQILAFVERIYIYVLDREPEAEGAAFWSDELYSFRRTGAEVAQGFIFSDEFVNRRTSDKEFVTILYKTFFGRDPEEEGLNFWLNQLATGAMDRVTVANGFIYSQEWADTCASYGIRSGGELKPSGKIAPTELTYAFVERMYTTAMGRSYDEEGKQYWAGELANFNITGEFVGAAFFLSDEMNGYNLSDKEYVGRLYATFMNREPDADGEAYWLSQMSAGVPRADIVFGFTRSPEFTEKCVVARILPY